MGLLRLHGDGWVRWWQASLGGVAAVDGGRASLEGAWLATLDVALL